MLYLPRCNIAVSFAREHMEYELRELLKPVGDFTHAELSGSRGSLDHRMTLLWRGSPTTSTMLRTGR